MILLKKSLQSIYLPVYLCNYLSSLVYMHIFLNSLIPASIKCKHIFLSLLISSLIHGSKFALFKLHMFKYLWFLLFWIIQSQYLIMWVFYHSSPLIFIDRWLYIFFSKFTCVHVLLSPHPHDCELFHSSVTLI